MSNFAVRVLAILAGFVLSSQIAYAHSEAEPVWAMDAAELQKLEASVERHRQNLKLAIDAALESGISTSPVRPYFFDSNQEVADIPRSVLNRVIIESLNLEIATTKLYVFCDAKCDRSLFKDLVDEPNRDESVRAIRGVWPRIANSFAFLWHDIPVGTWKRFIHASKYSRSLVATARYQSKAYGGISMAAGAAAFGVAFGITEFAEWAFMGPFHIVCQANYFWSIAIAAAVASFSREVKTLFLFESDGTSLFKRVARAFSGYRSLHAVQNLEKRILFRTLSDIDTFEKVSRRDAYIGALRRWLETPSARQAVAADGLLWADLAQHLSKRETQIQPRESVETKEQKLLGSEITEILQANTDPKRGQRRWQDIHASLRTLLRILRNSVDLGHQLNGDRADAIKILGTLDQQLRAFDIFTQTWLLSRSMKKSDDPILQTSETSEAAKWLRGQLTEWIAVAFSASERDRDAKQLKTRLNLIQSTLNQAIRSGTPERTCRALFLPASI